MKHDPEIFSWNFDTKPAGNPGAVIERWSTMPKSASSDDTPKWSTVEESVAKHILSQGEIYLRGQMQLALDADKRALVLAGFFTTFSTALSAASISYFNKVADYHVLTSCLIGASAAFIAAIICFYSARPVPFRLPGNAPASYWPMASDPLKELIGLETENYQDMISQNDAFLKGNAKFVKIAVVIFLSSPVLIVSSYYLQTSLSTQAQRQASSFQVPAWRHELTCGQENRTLANPDGPR